jgi:hypothetical protein
MSSQTTHRNDGKSSTDFSLCRFGYVQVCTGCSLCYLSCDL